MKTKFQIALENNECPEFFKGQGQYFSRDPDWGDHLYINNWQGLCGYLKLKENPNKILLDAFREYLTSLQISYEDADSLLLNISCYYLLRHDASLISEDNFDLIANLSDHHKKTIGELFRLLRREYDIQNASKPVISFDQFLSEIKTNGCHFDLEKL
ncbi:MULTISPECIES: hypothetical protein [Pseudomonas]|uniref:Uncharacterized protein n=1 Tax=Pseudomonas frederiksbergensis TaxID=104087 RepID=A0A6L5BUB8_9PSED|nr:MULTISPECIES: hypothetical protein [Pseudomonas]KAF2391645.1 hypothetical protein FX983_06130 [Pseudomonas frederiksbergensis]MDN3223993.1 hypothetical protein [Pseudomonas nunensis]